MQVKLRQVGNSIGLTLPASELRALSAKPGDIVELEITRIVRRAREGWDVTTRWSGANDAPLLLAELPNSHFENEEWEW